NVGGENVAVKNEHPGRAKTLTGDAIIACGREPASRDEAEADDGANRDAHRGGDEIVLEGIFHEKHDPEEEDEPADPGEEFYAEERFPIERLRGHRWRHWWRRWNIDWPRERRRNGRRRWRRWHWFHRRRGWPNEWCGRRNDGFSFFRFGHRLRGCGGHTAR